MFRPVIIQAVSATFVLAKFPMLISTLVLNAIEAKIVEKLARKPLCYLEDCRTPTKWICRACELPTCDPHLNDKNGLCPRCEANMIEAAERDEETSEEPTTEEVTETSQTQEEGPPTETEGEAPVATKKSRVFFINRIRNPDLEKN